MAVTTRTLLDYLSSLPPTQAEDASLVTIDGQQFSSANFVTNSDVSQVGRTGEYADLLNAPVLGTAAFENATDFAPASSGDLAATALQPADVGTAAYEDVSYFAVQSQGLKADTALQSVVAGDNVTIDNSDPLNPVINAYTGAVVEIVAGDNVTVDSTDPARPIVSAIGGGTGGQVNTVVGGNGIEVVSTDPVNPVVNIQDGYLGTAAFEDASSFATASEGDLATSSLQPDDIGVSVQAQSAKLTTLAGQTWANDRFTYYTGTGTAAIGTITSAGRALIDDASTAAQRTTLGLVIGTDVQAYSASLANWAGVTRATGFDAFTASPSSANLRSLLTDETGTGAAYFQGGDLGTPSAAVLTNGTNLPLTGTTGTLALNRGGTGATTADQARINLGVGDPENDAYFLSCAMG